MDQDFVKIQEEEPPKKHIEWSKIIKIILVVLLIFGALYLLKDWLMPKEEVNLGLFSPSEVDLTAIPQLERY